VGGAPARATAEAGRSARNGREGPPRGLHRYRRWSQLFFLLLFLGFLTLTVWPLGRVYLGAFLVVDPLMALNSLVNGVVRWEMLLALVVLLSPLVLGRAFCGYVCPLGFLVELTGPRRQRPKTGRSHEVLRRLPPYILVVVLGFLLFSSAAYLVFDPLSLVTRSATTLLFPFLDRMARLGGDILYLAPPLRGSVDTATGILTGRIIFAHPLMFQLQLGILGMFVGVLALSLVERRLWCRYLCPLGALLGLVGRAAVFGRVVDQSKCVNCLKCEAVCPLDAIRGQGLATDPTRCQLGLECADTCPEGAVHLGFRGKKVAYDPERRALLKAGGLTLLGGFFLFTSSARAERNVYLIRPPGASGENYFLGLCSRCGQCMKVCPTNVIQPAVLAAGLEGMMTPQMHFEHGYCDYSCNECGKVCPTGAIRPLTLEVKRRTVIGRAYIDKNRCIPWADGTNCLVCQELCPTPDKAVVFTEETVAVPAGGTATLKRPQVVADRCIGCGICEFNCPVAHEAAIRVRAGRGQVSAGQPTALLPGGRRARA
jgi:ferredoxin-type protein NapF